jgi:hypothetical protein
MKAALAVFVLASSAAAADRYAGRWVSETSGHSGPMRATITPGPGVYTVRYTGRFAGIVPFTYRAPMTVVGTSGDAVFLAAERRLPGFGTFRTDATLTPASFDAAYSSRRDRGRFTLSR